MSPTVKRPPRAVRPCDCRGVASHPGYPTVREHLATRRDVLTFVGASTVTCVLSACLTGKPALPDYHTFRIPAAGELETTLASGEACRFYVNGRSETQASFDPQAAQERCLEVLGATTATALSTDSGSGVERALRDALAGTIPDLVDVTLTATLL